MKKGSLFLVAISVICFSPITQETVAASPSQPQPDWKVGDSWAVRTWCAAVTNYGHKKRKNIYIKKGIPVDVSFKVSAIKSTAGFKIPYMPSDLRERAKEKYKNMPEKGYKCFEIEVVFPKEETGFQERYLLYFRQDTKSLIRVLNSSIRSDGSVVNLATDYPIDPNGPIMASGDIPSGTPFDFPDFTKGDDFSKEELLDRKGKDKRTTIQKMKHGKLKASDGKEFEGYEIKMSVRRNGKETVRSVQKWREKDPWWYEIKRFRDGECLSDATLINSTNDDG